MISEALNEQAALYALDALQGDERLAFLKSLAADSELAGLVAEYRDASAWVAHSAREVTPPSELKRRILALASRERVTPPSPLMMLARPVKNSQDGLQPLIPWALAAGFAIFAGILWGNSKQSNADTSQLARQREIVTGLFARVAELEGNAESRERALASMVEEVRILQETNRLADVQLDILSSKLDASGLASVVWDPASQQGVLQVLRLPEPGAGQDYQLWVIGPDRQLPVSAGIFRVNPDGSATVNFAPAQPVPSATTFAVTLEKAGGVLEPEGPVVIAN